MSDHVSDAHDLRVGGWLEVPGQRQPPEPADADTVVFPAIRRDAPPPAETAPPAAPVGPPEQRTMPFAPPSRGHQQPPVGHDAPATLPRRLPQAAPRHDDNAPTVQFPVIRDASGRGSAAGPATVTWQTPTGHLAPTARTTPTAQAPSTNQAPAAPPKVGRQTPTEPPPVSVRGLPMFLAALLGLGTIGIVFMTMPGSGKAHSKPKANASAPVSPVASAAPTGAPSAPPSHPAAGGATPSRAVLGNLDLQTMGKFCASRDAGFATLRHAPQGTGAAIDNWACTGKSRTRGFTIVPTDVCEWRYGSSTVAGYLDRNDAYSWRCYR